MTYKAIRQQIHIIPELVKSALLSQALDVEQVIASTFRPSAEFSAAAASLPLDELAKAESLYSDLSFKAFEAGVRYAKTKPKNQEMPVAFAADLLSRFKSAVAGLSPAALEESASKLSVGLAEAFSEGTSEGGLKASDKLTVKASNEAMEAYTKLLGTAESERVLRYYLGLGDKPSAPVEPSEVVVVTVEPKEEPLATAAAEIDVISFPAFVKSEEEPEEAVEEKEVNLDKVGPFYVGPLREAIVEHCKDFAEKTEKNDGVYQSLTDGDLEFFVIDELVPGCDKLGDGALIRAMCQVLELSDCESLEAAFDCGDEIAKKLTKEIDLDGSLLLMTLDDCYSLVFSFKPKDLKKLCKVEAAVKQDKTLARSPMGALSVKVQDEVRSMFKLPVNFMFKDLKKASPKVAEYYGSTLTDIRNSKIAIKDGTRLLNAGITSAILAVYGQDAVDFYQTL